VHRVGNMMVIAAKLGWWGASGISRLLGAAKLPMLRHWVSGIILTSVVDASSRLRQGLTFTRHGIWMQWMHASTIVSTEVFIIGHYIGRIGLHLPAMVQLAVLGTVFDW